MVNNSKKLPCGHIFHTVCLRSWFQRQQTCPTCRLNILRTPITSTQPVQAVNNANNNARPEQQQNQAQQPQQPIIAPNPFLNFMNQAAMNNNNQPQSASGIPNSPFIPSTSAGPNIPMPPPFFLPPFMAPYTIPPPPMPQNLDQLTIEELRAMEGNERGHVEERLKLLKNINTMINASITLMNQYQMVITNLPPVPTVSTSTEMPTNSEKEASPSTSSSLTNNKTDDEEKIDITKVKVEDLGSEIHLDQPKTSSSIDSNSSPTTSSIIIDSPSSSSSAAFIANETSNNTNGEPDETNEIRKRRLQKFLPN